MTPRALTGLHTLEGLITQLRPRRVLAFGAHPDDVDFGASATIAALTDHGIDVVLCLLTAGDAGHAGDAGTDQTPEQIAARRRIEQEQAAAELGISEVRVLGERDGFVEATSRLVGEIVQVMRQVRADVVISMHPERAWDRLQKSHPDHLACGEAVVRAAYPAVENRFAYPELAQAGLEPLKIRHLLLIGGPEHLAETRVEVTGYEERKLAALRRHLSQHPDPEKMERYVLEVLGQTHGEGGSAEAFHHVVVNDEETIAGF